MPHIHSKLCFLDLQGLCRRHHCKDKFVNSPHPMLLSFSLLPQGFRSIDRDSEYGSVFTVTFNLSSTRFPPPSTFSLIERD